MPSILVSYRRSDSSATAGRIYDHLVSHFGEGSVFMDVDAIPFGTDFRTHIKSALEKSDILVAVIGPGWLGAGPEGRRRIDDEADPVRVEVETALAHGITIVPVLIDSTVMPGTNLLPASLRPLAFLNAAPVDMGRDFRPHMDRLSRSLDAILATKGGALAAKDGALAGKAGGTAPAAGVPPSGLPPRHRRTAALAAAALAVTLGLGAFGYRHWTSPHAGASGAVALGGPVLPKPASAGEFMTQVALGPYASRVPVIQGAFTAGYDSARPSPAPAAAKRSALHGTFAWHELWTTDTAAAGSFYRGVIGWDGRTTGEGEAAYTTFLAGQVPAAGLATLPKRTIAGGARPAWVGYVTVSDVDASVTEAKALGARIYVGPADIPGIGRYATIADPQGATIVLFKGLSDAAPAMPAPTAPGQTGWRVLETGDRDAAVAFYEKLFGWTVGPSADADPSGSESFAAGPTTLGAIRWKPEAAIPAWTYYFQVDGLAAAAARVKGAGGTVYDPPQQTRGGAWVVRALDPQGAAFALISATR